MKTYLIKLNVRQGDFESTEAFMLEALDYDAVHLIAKEFSREWYGGYYAFAEGAEEEYEETGYHLHCDGQVATQVQDIKEIPSQDVTIVANYFNKLDTSRIR